MSLRSLGMFNSRYILQYNQWNLFQLTKHYIMLPVLRVGINETTNTKIYFYNETGPTLLFSSIKFLRILLISLL